MLIANVGLSALEVAGWFFLLLAGLYGVGVAGGLSGLLRILPGGRRRASTGGDSKRRRFRLWTLLRDLLLTAAAVAIGWTSFSLLWQIERYEAEPVSLGPLDSIAGSGPRTIGRLIHDPEAGRWELERLNGSSGEVVGRVQIPVAEDDRDNAEGTGGGGSVGTTGLSIRIHRIAVSGPFIPIAEGPRMIQLVAVESGETSRAVHPAEVVPSAPWTELLWIAELDASTRTFRAVRGERRVWLLTVGPDGLTGESTS